MIFVKDISVLEANVDAIIHQANCFRAMGSGVAKAIVTKYPEAYEADMHTKSGDSRKLGDFSFAKTSDGKIIYNCYSQFKFGGGQKHTNYDAMVEALEKIKAHAKEKGVKRIGVPKNMGCVLGGGSWRIVSAILKDVFLDEKDLDVIVCNYPGK